MLALTLACPYRCCAHPSGQAREKILVEEHAARTPRGDRGKKCRRLQCVPCEACASKRDLPTTAGLCRPGQDTEPGTRYGAGALEL